MGPQPRALPEDVPHLRGADVTGLPGHARRLGHTVELGRAPRGRNQPRRARRRVAHRAAEPLGSPVCQVRNDSDSGLVPLRTWMGVSPGARRWMFCRVVAPRERIVTRCGSERRGCPVLSDGNSCSRPWRHRPGRWFLEWRSRSLPPYFYCPGRLRPLSRATLRPTPGHQGRCRTARWTSC